VFLTWDERLGREVAVKRLHGAEVTGQTAQRLRREARIMASLRHSSLVTVYDMAESHDKAMVINDIRLLEKSGGRSGHWRAQSEE